MRCGLAILACLAASWGSAADSAQSLAEAGVAEFNAAYQAWDGARFGAAAELFRLATVYAPTSSICFYWLGTSHFHRMLQLQNVPGTRSNAVSAAAAMESALSALKNAVKLDERHAESHALLGTLYGMKIGGSLLRGIRLGPSVQKHRNKALEFGADNPRVAYLLGVGQFQTAKSAAARRAALATLLRADGLFKREAERQAGPLEPRWGWSSCHTFIGRVYESLGQKPEAARYFGQALDKHPADHIARDGLARVTGRG